MRFHLIFSFICYLYQSTSTKNKPELKKIVLNFGYRINCKFEGMLKHSSNRFYLVTKFIQHSKLIQLENSTLMYSIYNMETLEKLINTVHNIHNTTSTHKKMFAGQQSSLTLKSLYVHYLGLHHYSINSLLYLRTIKDKYIALYRVLITKL